MITYKSPPSVSQLVKLPYGAVCPSVGWSVARFFGQSVCLSKFQVLLPMLLSEHLILLVWKEPDGQGIMDSLQNSNMSALIVFFVHPSVRYYS